MKKNFIVTLALMLGACAYTPTPKSSAPGSEVGATGDIGYTHEALGGDKHLVTITAAPGVMETESSIAQRIHIFATRFAAQTCPRKFEFINDPNLDQQTSRGFMKRTKTYTFICAT